jgi:hypothetical protein
MYEWNSKAEVAGDDGTLKNFAKVDEVADSIFGYRVDS